MTQTDLLVERLDPAVAAAMRRMRAAEGDTATDELAAEVARDVVKDYPELKDSIEQVRLLVPGMGRKRTPELLMKLGLFLESQDTEIRVAVREFLVQIGAA